MFIFGVDVPLVEYFVTLSVIMTAVVIVLVWLLLKVMSINKKLDLVLKDEKKFHSELRETKDEEDEQLILMKKMIKEIALLDHIADQENEQLKYIKENILQEIKGIRLLKGKGSLNGKQIKDFVDKIESIDRISKQEDEQLKTIKDMLLHLEKQRKKENSRK